MATDEQRRIINEFRERWLKIGVSTKKADKTEVEKAICELYKHTEKYTLEEEFPAIWVQSPWAACAMMSIMDHDMDMALGLLKEYRDYENNRDVVPTAAIRDFVADHNVPLFYYRTNFWGQQEAYWVAFYRCGQALGAKYEPLDNEKLGLWESLCHHSSWWWAYSKRVVCSERPVTLHRQDNMLHKDGAAAVSYEDGWGTYALNGVRVPDWLALQPAEEIDAKKLIEIRNADVRREFVRKIGVERIYIGLGAEVKDTDTINGFKYELVDLNIEEDNPDYNYRFLKFPNASGHIHAHLADVIHLEGVPSETRTVKEALAFRNGRIGSPSQLT